MNRARASVSANVRRPSRTDKVSVCRVASSPACCAAYNSCKVVQLTELEVNAPGCRAVRGKVLLVVGRWMGRTEGPRDRGEVGALGGACRRKDSALPSRLLAAYASSRADRGAQQLRTTACRYGGRNQRASRPEADDLRP